MPVRKWVPSRPLDLALLPSDAAWVPRRKRSPRLVQRALATLLIHDSEVAPTGPADPGPRQPAANKIVMSCGAAVERLDDLSVGGRLRRLGPTPHRCQHQHLERALSSQPETMEPTTPAGVAQRLGWRLPENRIHSMDILSTVSLVIGLAAAIRFPHGGRPCAPNDARSPSRSTVMWPTDAPSGWAGVTCAAPLVVAIRALGSANAAGAPQLRRCSSIGVGARGSPAEPSMEVRNA